MSLGLHVTIANLLFMVTVELNLGGFHITWGFHDALRAELEKEHERGRYYRPTTNPTPAEIDERFRRNQA